MEQTPTLTGILILVGNRTYGTHNNKKLYKCIPYDKTITQPIYIPYEMKHIGFSKSFDNKYVTFVLKEGEQGIATLTNCIGSTNSYDAFITYLLISNNLLETRKSVKQIEQKICDNMQKISNNINEKYNIEDRTVYHVFTIDGETTKDFDDAIGILTINTNHYVVSTYIANVPLWITELRLWDDIKNKISSIYLPDDTINMLPPTLSENICSLKSGESKYVFAIDMEIINNKIANVSFKNAKVKIAKNYVYEEWKLANNNDYKLIYEIMENLEPVDDCDIVVTNSETLIAKLMVLTNHFSANILKENNKGIFKTATRKTGISQQNNPSITGGDLPQIFNYWKKCDCQYETKNTNHDILGLSAYTHITSPIRRIVDIINMVEIQNALSLNDVSEDALRFVEMHKANVENINTVAKKIKKIQTNAQLLHYFNLLKGENLFEGYVLEVVEKGLSKQPHRLECLVYIPIMQMVNLVKTEKVLQIYEKKMFKIFVFTKEANFKQKIRLQIVDEEE
jgi:exoribonuclease R